MTRIDTRLASLALHKARLIERMDAQRAGVRRCADELRGPAAVADQGIAVVNFLRAHPLLVSAAVAAVVALRGRGRGVLAVAGRAVSLWRLWRTVVAWSSSRPA